MGDGSDNDLTFEGAMEKLAQVVADLETGNLQLEESLLRFEEGIKLAKLCSKMLEEAESRIEILGKDGDGNTVLQPYAADVLGDDG